MMKRLYYLTLFLCFTAFSLTAQLETVITGLSFPFGLALDGNELYVSQNTGSRISKFDITDASPMLEDVLLGLSSPGALLLKGDTLFFGESGRISKINITDDTPVKETVVLTSSFYTTIGLALDGDVLYYTTDVNGSVFKIDLSQQPNPPIETVATGFSNSFAPAFKGTDLYVSDFGAGTVSKIDLTTTPATVTTLVSGLSQPGGLTFNGNFLYVAESSKVSRIDINADMPIAETVVTGLASSRLVAFDGLDMYITEVSFGRISKLLIGTPVFSNLGTVCTGTTWTDLGGASPTGGTYSGPGVTDNGNGETFTFDPAAAGGVGSYTITYTAINGETITNTLEVTTPPDVTFTAPGPYNTTDGAQTLTGGMPAGGAYSGNGVTDNGDGTYSFNPSVVGAGTTTVTYTFEDGNGCSGSAMADIVVNCVDPVINGVTVISCNGNFLSIEVDGELNGATTWEWTSNFGTGNDECETQPSFATGSAVNSDYLAAPDRIFHVRAVGGCTTEPVCFGFVPEDLIADALGVSFTAPGPFQTTDGIQALTQGMPAGGTYSGTGVIDNGDGTYSFDPAIGAGDYVITYTITGDNGCSGSVEGTIVVEECNLPVINGVSITNCNGNNGTFVVDGELNGATTWEWTINTFGAPCESATAFATGAEVTSDYLAAPDDFYFVRAVGGCITEPVCFSFVPSELIADALGVSFTAPGPFQTTDGIQALTQGMPMGGTYSGTGVIDNGDGTYSFDPSIGEGEYTVTYMVTSDNGCSGSAEATIVVNTPEMGTAYITNAEAGTVDVIDLETKTVVTSIDLGGGVPYGIALKDDFTKVYVGQVNANALVVIDAATNTIDTTIAVGTNPFGVAYNAFENRIYVADFGSDDLTEIDATTYETSIAEVGHRPYGVATAPVINVGATLVTDFSEMNLTLLNNGTASTTIQVGNAPTGVTFSPNGLKAYVANFQDNTIVEVDAFSLAVDNTVSVGTDPFGVVTNTEGTKLYVTNQGSNDVSVVDLASFSVEATIPVGNAPYGIDITPDGKEAYVACAGDNQVYVIDLVTNTVTNMIDVGASPRSFGIFISPYVNEIEALIGEDCDIAIEIDSLFGGPVGVAQESGIYNNTEYTSEDDPAIEAGCFFEDDAYSNTMWFTFIGDGNSYNIASNTNNTNSPLDNGDTQIAIYTGDCDDLTFVACNEDEDPANNIFNISIDFDTEEGVEYTFIIDGWNGSAGEYRLQITNLGGSLLPGDDCTNAYDINTLFGQTENEPQTSELYDNTDYTSVNDPMDGFECFGEENSGQGEPTLLHTIWFTFEGDGGVYNIKTVECNATNYILEGNTQAVIYAGSCGELDPIECFENGPDDIFNNIDIDIQTEPGVTYQIMVDNRNDFIDGPGEFCIEVTNLGPNNVSNILVESFSIYPNPTNDMINIEGVTPDEVRINDSFGRLLIQSAENTNQVDLSDLPAGVYYIQVSVDGAWATQRVVKQ